MTELQATVLERMLRDLAENDALTGIKVTWATHNGGYFGVYANRYSDVGMGIAGTLAEAYREALADLKEAVA